MCHVSMHFAFFGSDVAIAFPLFCCARATEDPFAARPLRAAPPGAPPPGPLAALRSAGVSAAIAFRSAAPGRAAAFTSILEARPRRLT
jgi:hypothetical protein